MNRMLCILSFGYFLCVVNRGSWCLRTHLFFHMFSMKFDQIQCVVNFFLFFAPRLTHNWLSHIQSNVEKQNQLARIRHLRLFCFLFLTDECPFSAGATLINRPAKRRQKKPFKKYEMNSWTEHTHSMLVFPYFAHSLKNCFTCVDWMHCICHCLRAGMRLNGHDSFILSIYKICLFNRNNPA